MSTFIPLGKADKNTVKVLYSDGDCPVAVSQDSRLCILNFKKICHKSFLTVIFD